MLHAYIKVWTYVMMNHGGKDGPLSVATVCCADRRYLLYQRKSSHFIMLNAVPFENISAILL